MNKLSRRDFLKIAGLGIGSAVALSNLEWGGDSAPKDPQERIEYIENHAVFKKINEITINDGLPPLYDANYFSQSSLSINSKNLIEYSQPPDDNYDYKKVLEDILRLAYEFTGDVTNNYLHHVKFDNGDRQGFSASPHIKRLNIPVIIKNKINNQILLTPKGVSTIIHEFSHLIDLGVNVMTLDTKLETELAKMQAITKNGILRTYHDIYSYNTFVNSQTELEESSEPSLITQIGNNFVKLNSDIVIGYEDFYKLKNDTKNINQNDKWSLYQTGIAFLDILRKNPVDIPIEVKQIATSVILGSNVLSEGWSSILELIINPGYENYDENQQKYSTDDSLKMYVAKYLSIFTNKPVLLDDLIYRLRNPSKNRLKYEQVDYQS